MRQANKVEGPKASAIHGIITNETSVPNTVEPFASQGSAVVNQSRVSLLDVTVSRTNTNSGSMG